MDFVEPGKDVYAPSGVSMVWAKDFLTDCQSSFVEWLDLPLD